MALREVGDAMERRRTGTLFGVGGHGSAREDACQSCGSLTHITSSCRHRDDLESTVGRNGEYAGPLPVRRLPPGYSYRDRIGERGVPKPAPGQVWRSPVDKLFAVVSVERGVVRLVVRCVGTRSGLGHFSTKVKVRTLRSTWVFVRAE